MQLCDQHFLEAGEASGPGTNFIESRGPVSVANHIGFSFYRQVSCWNIVCISVVNVFSKQARFQDLGPIPSNRGDL